MNLIAFLQQQDILLFQFLNHLVAHPVWDGFWVTITTQKYWMAPLLVVWLVLLWRGGRRDRLAALLVLLAIGASDAISARVLKPGVGRVRPCYELENVRLLISCGGRHSFPSNHAANAFAAAVTFSFFYRRYTGYFIATALLVGLSRIFVGVHYPGDVLGGFIVGSLCAGIFLLLYQKLLNKS